MSKSEDAEQPVYQVLKSRTIVLISAMLVVVGLGIGAWLVLAYGQGDDNARLDAITEARFSGVAEFREAQFRVTAWFTGARFSSARFSGVTGFDEAQFRRGAMFDGRERTDVPDGVRRVAYGVRGDDASYR